MEERGIVSIPGTYKKVAVTGPSPKNMLGYDAKLYVNMVQQLRNIIIDLSVKNGTDTIITDGEQGAGMIAAIAASLAKMEGAKITSAVYLPFYQQDQKYPEQNIFSKIEYRNILMHADYMKLTSNTVALQADANRDKLILLNRAHMVNDSNLLIAVSRDTLPPGVTEKKTEQNIKYAENAGKSVLRLKYAANPTNGVHFTKWEMINP